MLTGGGQRGVRHEMREISVQDVVEVIQASLGGEPPDRDLLCLFMLRNECEKLFVFPARRSLSQDVADLHPMRDLALMQLL
jgi:hypothetical protein